ncbi:hypothetical protein RFI_28535 [Reticulomyxa filosa]|uniref:Uncharacterized protein n=1 Tax=Reticulomyxa filosa TaxID=46433 RepID=X6M5V4_RETFI|nr:hypothetical protein RFI_28535 [Reticulomyxa filosa]|eukprot:ETO08852.1 hypothetical protein RFI_28535 [Reticulomyxa filosa]
MESSSAAPQFPSVGFSHEPTKRDMFTIQHMNESYEELIEEMVAACNSYIDRIKGWKDKVNISAPFFHCRVDSTSMNESIHGLVDKVYEMWFAVFSMFICIAKKKKKSISWLQRRTHICTYMYIRIYVDRDFIEALIVTEQLLKSGFKPNDTMMRYLAAIPNHCCLEREMVLLDRWMVRLDVLPSLGYLEDIIKANSRRLHVEYRKFECYYRDTRLPLPQRSEFGFYDQDPVDCYPYTHVLDCAPESFFDYYLTDLPKRILLHCQCKTCKRLLSGEEIIAGFENYKQYKVLFLEFTGMKASQTTMNSSLISRPPSKWAIICPVCFSELIRLLVCLVSPENAAVLDLFGGILPGEYKYSLNENISYLLVDTIDTSNHSKPSLITLPNLSNATTGNGPLGDDGGLTHTRKQYNMLSLQYLHDRILRIVEESYEHYPTTELPHSFLELAKMWNKDVKDDPQKKEKERAKPKPDRSIKVIRSKDDVFWNLFVYFQLFDLPINFLFGGKKEFEQEMKVVNKTSRNPKTLEKTQAITTNGLLGNSVLTTKEYLLAALPHHSWCIVHRNAKEEEDDDPTKHSEESSNDYERSSVHEKHSSDDSQFHEWVIRPPLLTQEKMDIASLYVIDTRLERMEPDLYKALVDGINAKGTGKALRLLLDCRKQMEEQKTREHSKTNVASTNAMSSTSGWSVHESIETSEVSLSGSGASSATLSGTKHKPQLLSSGNIELEKVLMKEPLYRIVGKIQPALGRFQVLEFAKSFEKAVAKMGTNSRKFFRQNRDKGIVAAFAPRIQDVVLLVRDTYHSVELSDLALGLSKHLCLCMCFFCIPKRTTRRYMKTIVCMCNRKRK